MAERDWQIFQLGELLQSFSDKAVEYQEFLRVPALNCGLYRLEAGAEDSQIPHEEDEVYYVLEGKGRLRTENAEHDIRPGSVLYPVRSLRPKWSGTSSCSDTLQVAVCITPLLGYPRWQPIRLGGISTGLKKRREDRRVDTNDGLSLPMPSFGGSTDVPRRWTA